MKNEPKQYEIKIPVYVSESIELESNTLFSNNNDTLLQNVKALIAKYNNNPSERVFTEKKNKTNRIGIESINTIDISFNKEKCLILQATAYKTNLLDGYYQNVTDSKKIDFQQSDKICSNTYFYVLYPLIRRNYKKNTDEVYWQLFVYEDPSKPNDEMIQIGRSIMSKILKTPIKNIKSEKLIEDLKRHALADVEIVLSSFDEGSTDDVPEYVKDYKFVCKTKREKRMTLSEMKIEDVMDIYRDRKDFDKEKFDRRQLKVSTEDKHTYSIIQEFKENLKETIEESFNYKANVSEDDIKNKTIFNIDEIKTHMEGVFCNYIANND